MAKITSIDRNLLKRRSIVVFLMLIGSSILVYCLQHPSELEDSLLSIFFWGLGVLSGFVSLFVGWSLAANWSDKWLKIIDLIWVVSSSIAIVFAFATAGQFFIEHEKKQVQLQIDEIRHAASKEFLQDYKRDCQCANATERPQCVRLRKVKEAFDSCSLPDVLLLNLVCIEATKAGNASIVDITKSCKKVGQAWQEKQKIRDNETEEVDWAIKRWVVALFLILIVAFRVSKSITECFLKSDTKGTDSVKHSGS